MTRPLTRRAIGPLLLAVAVAGCAETTVDPTRTTSASNLPATTAVAVATTTTGLFDQLAAETAGLSALIVAGEGDDAALARIETIWASLQPLVEADHAELLADLEAVIGLTRRAVERRRPADADKAHNNLRTIIAAAS